MKFLIMGAGAIGSVLGGFLAKNGHEVTLVGRERHIQAIRNNGLLINGIWGEHKINREKLTSLLTEPMPQEYDFVLITVKSYDTLKTAEELKSVFSSYLKKNKIIFVSIQNGIGNIEIFEKFLGETTVAGARVIFGAKITEPGCVTVTVIAEPTAIGLNRRKKIKVKEEEKIKKLKDLTAALNSSGISSEFVMDISPYLWAKVFYNSALNPLSALLNRTYGELAENQFTRNIMDRVIDEAFLVAKGMGVKLFWKNSSEYKRHFYNKLIPPTANHYASMLEDLKRKKTEIDSINGAIVRYGKKLKIVTPANEMLTNIIKSIC